MDLLTLTVVLVALGLKIALALAVLYFLLSVPRSLRRIAVAKENQADALVSIAENINWATDQLQELMDESGKFFEELNKLFPSKKAGGDGTMEPAAPADTSGAMEER